MEEVTKQKVSLSVVIPVYNVELEFLQECLDSVEAQTFRDFEVIIVNDGAGAEISEFLSDYSSKYDYIKVFSQPNSGVAVARNFGLSQCSGEYVTFIDSDDTITKDNFEKIMQEAAERFGDSPFVATSDEGELIGFFCYSVNMDNNEGMLKFVMNNPRYRGQGYGKEMINLAVKYAFEITNVQAVHLNVFPENTRAKKCYESVGFTERKTDMNAFVYKNEAWGRCNMIIRKN